MIHFVKFVIFTLFAITHKLINKKNINKCFKLISTKVRSKRTRCIPKYEIRICNCSCSVPLSISLFDFILYPCFSLHLYNSAATLWKITAICAPILNLLNKTKYSFESTMHFVMFLFLAIVLQMRNISTYP